ncbi:DUF418 domain-containing protein [Nonomuraea africana]|uniref:DUF418 domain-containing protein n=1 Tax=Nonomuraea africana TaxID=46171 RepID=UPI001CEF5588|nr:DUF418 domain-containing protein [Nonomuraea africana]
MRSAGVRPSSAAAAARPWRARPPRPRTSPRPVLDGGVPGLFSILWLRRYRQGPIEWLWRWATWAHRPADTGIPVVVMAGRGVSV